MSDDAGRGTRPPWATGEPDGLAEFAEELKLLAEAVLERVEPVFRQAAEGQTEWSSCSWCPVCAAAALVRGEHHEVLTAVADHGTAIVTVLREALAGVPVEPVMSDRAGSGAQAPHEHSIFADQAEDAPAAAADPDAVHERSTEQQPSSGRKRSRYIGIPVTIKT